MTSTLVSDDALYAELFDVQKEASALGGQVYGDLTPAMNALRDKAPVLKGSLHELLELPNGHGAYDTDREHYTLLSYEMCNRALRENLLFSSEVYEESPGVRMMGDVILKMTGPQHMRYRMMVQPMFIRPKAMKWWKKNWIDASVEALIDRLAANKTADLNLDLCARLPVNIVTQGIGMAGEDALVFRTHLIKSTVMLGTVPMEEIIESAGIVETMLRQLIVARRESPQDDVMSNMVHADLAQDGAESRKLTDDEIFAYCRLIILAGGGTTWRQLGITIYQLLSNYHLWEACREDRSLIEPAIEEAARWMPTDPTFPRLVMEDVVLPGITIPAGARVDMCLGSANRDPAVWENPDEFDIYRPRKTHLGFGMGPHRCLGLEVAKQEMLAAINGLLDRFPNMTLDPNAPEPKLAGGVQQRGMTAIPVILN